MCRRPARKRLTRAGGFAGLSCDARRQQVLQTHAAIHFPAHSVGDAIDYLGTVLRGIDVDPKWALAEGGADNAHDLASDLGRISVARMEA